MFWKKKKEAQLEFYGHMQTKYEAYNDCYVTLGGQVIAYIHGISQSGPVLHIEHFALATNPQARGRAEECIREFAKFVKNKSPEVTTIEFDLGRALRDDEVEELADKREALLLRLGCPDVHKHPMVNDRIVVSATWPKSAW
ncbi:hypothetical protein KUK74_004357 [Vibrio parahaemolyticus]|nr:hypothetical protein [Vibrio parahaemolyticus]